MLVFVLVVGVEDDDVEALDLTMVGFFWLVLLECALLLFVVFALLLVIPAPLLLVVVVVVPIKSDVLGGLSTVTRSFPVLFIVQGGCAKVTPFVVIAAFAICVVVLFSMEEVAGGKAVRAIAMVVETWGVVAVGLVVDVVLSLRGFRAASMVGLFCDNGMVFDKSLGSRSSTIFIKLNETSVGVDFRSNNDNGNPSCLG